MDDELVTNELNCDVETELTGIKSDATEVDQFSSSIANANADAGLADNILHIALGASKGLSQTDVKMATIAVEALCQRLGIHNAPAFLAVEEFGSTKNKVESTRISLENLQEIIVRVWKAIKEGFIKLWEKVKMFLLKIFNFVPLLEKYAKHLKAKANAIPHNGKPMSSLIENESLFRAFATSNKFNLDEVQYTLETHTKINEAGVRFNHAVEQAIDKVKTITDGISSGKVFTKTEINNEIVEVMNNTTVYGPGFTKENAKSNIIFTSEPLVNNKQLIIRTGVKKKFSVEPHYGSLYLMSRTVDCIEVVEEQAVDPNSIHPKAFETLKPKQIIDLCDSVLDLCISTTNLRNKIGDIGKTERNITSVIDKAIKAINSKFSSIEEDENQVDLKKMFSEVRQAINALGQAQCKYFTKAPALAVVAGKRALSYASLSLKEYRGQAVDLSADTRMVPA